MGSEENNKLMLIILNQINYNKNYFNKKIINIKLLF